MDILKYPDPELLTGAREIEAVDDEVRALAEEMLRTMYANRGIGLAAPQVGVARRLIVVNPAAEPGEGKEIVLANPEVLEHDPDQEEGEEGCLSVPGVTAMVPRWRRVRVGGLGLDGCAVVVEGEGLLARVLQHEMDHLDGILFITRLNPVEKAAVKPKLRDMKAKAKAR